MGVWFLETRYSKASCDTFGIYLIEKSFARSRFESRSRMLGMNSCCDFQWPIVHEKNFVRSNVRHLCFVCINDFISKTDLYFMFIYLIEYLLSPFTAWFDTDFINPKENITLIITTETEDKTMLSSLHTQSEITFTVYK